MLIMRCHIISLLLLCSILCIRFFSATMESYTFPVMNVCSQLHQIIKFMRKNYDVLVFPELHQYSDFYPKSFWEHLCTNISTMKIYQRSQNPIKLPYPAMKLWSHKSIDSEPEMLIILSCTPHGKHSGTHGRRILNISSRRIPFSGMYESGDIQYLQFQLAFTFVCDPPEHYVDEERKNAIHFHSSIPCMLVSGSSWFLTHLFINLLLMQM